MVTWEPESGAATANESTPSPHSVSMCAENKCISSFGPSTPAYLHHIILHDFTREMRLCLRAERKYALAEALVALRWGQANKWPGRDAPSPWPPPHTSRQRSMVCLRCIRSGATQASQGGVWVAYRLGAVEKLAWYPAATSPRILGPLDSPSFLGRPEPARDRPGLAKRRAAHVCKYARRAEGGSASQAGTMP